MLKLYNTLTREKEQFKPIKKGHVNMYSCGPTVYWYQHIGNMRAYIFSDIVKRTLAYNGYKITHVINITDVGHLTTDADEGEDKMEIAARKEGKKTIELADYYFGVFLKDFKKLNLIEPHIWAKATNHIKEQIELVKKLEKKGFTYQTEDGVYFDSSKFKDYGELAMLKIDGIEAGKRVAMGDKKNPTDFALWKFSLEPGIRQQEWDSPWGIGFPGWHIECSAMSMKYLGYHFDIHTGGEDHIPIHHTNEIAQSEAATGKKFVNYWLHGAFLVDKEGKKVSKSSGGLYTISELEEKGYPPLCYRYLCLQTHYRKQLQFSLESLDAAKNAYEKIKRKIIRLRKEKNPGNTDVAEHKSNFLKAINDDLNMPRALEVFWEVMEESDMNSKTRLATLEHFDDVLGLGVRNMKEKKVIIPQDVNELLAKRQYARKKKDFAEADRLRDKIKEMGYIIEDLTEGGPTLRPIQDN